MYYVNLKSSAYDIDEKLAVDAENLGELEEKLLEHLKISEGCLLIMDSLSDVDYDAQITNYGSYPSHYYLTLEKLQLLC